MTNARILFPALALSLAFVACDDSTSSNNTDQEGSSSSIATAGSSSSTQVLGSSSSAIVVESTELSGYTCSNTRTWDAGASSESTIFHFANGGAFTEEYHYLDHNASGDDKKDTEGKGTYQVEGDSLYMSFADEEKTLAYKHNAGQYTLLMPTTECSTTTGTIPTTTCVTNWVEFLCALSATE